MKTSENTMPTGAQVESEVGPVNRQADLNFAPPLQEVNREYLRDQIAMAVFAQVHQFNFDLHRMDGRLNGRPTPDWYSLFKGLVAADCYQWADAFLVAREK